MGLGLPPPRPQNPGQERSAALPQGSQGVPPTSAAGGEKKQGELVREDWAIQEGALPLKAPLGGEEGVKACSRGRGPRRASRAGIGACPT